MSIQNLEDLLNENAVQTRVVENKSLLPQHSTKILTADRNCNMFDFLKMVEKVVTKTLADLNVEFGPDEIKTIAMSPDLEMSRPMITYKVISRKPDGERKPRKRESIEEKDVEESERRLGEVWGQKFDCVVQFNVWASVYDAAEQVMEKFEEAIFTYTGYFKKNGVAELLFEEQLTDANYDIYRQKVSVRNLRYRVKIEKLTALFQERIREIETNGL